MIDTRAQYPDETDPRPTQPSPGLPAPVTEPEVFPSPPDPIPAPDTTPIETPMDPIDPIEALRGDHAFIERALTAFVAWSRNVATLGAKERAELERFTRFFDRFVDRCHHAKKEDVLFRVLQQADPRAGAIVRRSFLAQEEQRRLREHLEELTCRQRGGDAAELEALRSSVAAFVDSVRAHMRAEESVLFPTARTRIPPHALVHAGKEFAAVEARANVEHGRPRELGRALIETYAPTCRHVHRGLGSWQ